LSWASSGQTQRIVKARLLGLILLAAGLTGTVDAQLSETILSGTAITNYTGYIIDADRSSVTNNPAFDRESIRMQTIVRTTNTSGSLLSRTNVYVLRLLDTAGVPWPIFEAAGNTNAAATYNITNVFNVPAMGAVTNTNVASVVPAVRLRAHARYTVGLRIFTNGVFTTRTTNDGPRQYYHFTNLVSGDAAFNVIACVTNVVTNQLFAVQAISGKDAFRYDVRYELRRYDDFAVTNTAPTNIPVRINYVLSNATAGAVVPLVNSSTNFVVSLPPHTSATNPPAPAVANGQVTVNVKPVSQIDSVNHTFRLYATISHTNKTSVPLEVVTGNSTNTITVPGDRLLHFNGHLFFGSIDTTFSSINNSPGSNGIVVGTHIVTMLGVDANSGVIVGHPSHTYGSGAALSVNLLANGNAVLASGTVTVNQPVPDLDVTNRVRYQRVGPLTLTTGGAASPLRVTLPTGFSYRTNNTNFTLTFGTIDYASYPLDQSLGPIGSPVFTPGGGGIFAAEETKPVWFQCINIIWNTAMGKFTLTPSPSPNVHYVRWDEYDYLKSVPVAVLADPAMKTKRSNDRYFESLSGLGGTTEVFADANGHASLKTDLTLAGGNYLTHFPYDSAVAWTANSSMRVTNDNAVSGGLSNVASLSVSYTRDCPGCSAQPPDASVGVSPSNAVLNFTRDGGLVAGGTLTSTQALTWGYFSNSPTMNGYAQQSFTYDVGNFHMPGVFLRGDQTLLERNHRASTLLFTGIAATNLNTIERPDIYFTANAIGYVNGFADYAGLNFCVNVAGAKDGKSTVAGVVTPAYDLTARSKYYIRPGGVSGIHEAVPGTFPVNLVLYGYQFTFSNYGLNYLDSQNRDSRTDGSVYVPYPSDFTQSFKELKFNCVGGLTSAKVPQNDPDKELDYWTADFSTLAINFKRNAADECNPAEGSLVLGVRMTPFQLGTNLFGSLGFQTNGNLIPQSYGLEGVDSRLKAPNVVTIKGPNTERYNFTPVVDAYLNSYSNSPPTPGWLNVAGGLDVSFFEDVKVHLQTSADREGTNSLIYLMGGWPKAGSSAANQGWVDSAGSNYFSITYFDLDNFGKPNGVAIGDYRDNATEQYHPRAQKHWLRIVHFDYPLDWNTVTRSFKSHAPISNEFVIVNVQHQVKYLSAQHAELVFGIQYDGLPQINLTELAFNAVDELTGVSQAIVEAAGDKILQAVTNGIDHVTQMLDAKMDRFYDRIFDNVIDPVVCDAYIALSNNFQFFVTNNPCNYIPVAGSNIDYFIGGIYGTGVNISNQIATNLLGAVGQVSNVVGQVDKFLGDVQHAIDAILGGITNDIDGNYIGMQAGLFASTNAKVSKASVSNVIYRVTSKLAAQFINSVLNPSIDEFIADHETTFNEIITLLTNIREQVAALRAQLQSGQEFAVEMADKVNGLSGEILALCNQTRQDVSNFFGAIDCTIDNPFAQYSADEVKEMMRQRFEENFFASQIPQRINEILKQRVYDLDALMRESIDTLFAKMNEVIKDAISETLQTLDTKINGLIGDLNSVLGAAELNGYAHIKGDSLTLLRIDGHFQFKCPDNLELNAYIQIKELNSDGTATCAAGAGRATEVTIGATDVDLSWITPDLRANVAVKFSFQTTPSFKPIGVAGSFEVLGGLTFETFEIIELRAAIAFGATENYLSAQTRIKFNQYELAGGIYFGRTCTLDPIKLWAPDIAEVLGAPPFTGAYAYGEGWFPLNEALGIPSSCLFNIRAGVGAGAGYFVEGPTYVGAIFGGLDGEVLCLINVRGEAKLIGVKQGSDFRFKGTAKVSGKAGSCPFCIKFKKSFGIRYEQKKWKLD